MMTPEAEAELETAKTVALACHTLALELIAIVEALRHIKDDFTTELLAIRDQREAADDADFLLDV